MVSLGFFSINSSARSLYWKTSIYIESAFLLYYSATDFLRLFAGSYLSLFLSGNAKIKNEEYFVIIKNVLNEINGYVEGLFDENQKHYISKIEDQKNDDQ